MTGTTPVLHHAIESLVRREFQRVRRQQLDANENRSHTQGIDQPTQNNQPDQAPASSAAASSSTAGVSSCVAAVPPSPSPSPVPPAGVRPPLLTLHWMMRLCAPPSLPVSFDDLPTLWYLDRHHRGAISEDDFLNFTERCTRLVRRGRWKEIRVRSHLQAYFLREMYKQETTTNTNTKKTTTNKKKRGKEGEDEKIETADNNDVVSTTTNDYVSLTQWILLLLINHHPTSSFTHVGLRVLYLHRESIELLWELLRPYFPRPASSTLMSANGGGGGGGGGGFSSSESDGSMAILTELGHRFPSFSPMTSGIIASDNFQAFFDMLQHSGELCGLLDLDDEVLDHFVPLAVVEHMLQGVDRAFRNQAVQIGWKRTKEEKAQRKAEKASMRRNGAGAGAGCVDSSSLSIGGGSGVPTTGKHPHVMPTQGVPHDVSPELFTFLPNPPPSSFLTPRSTPILVPSTHSPTRLNQQSASGTVTGVIPPGMLQSIPVVPTSSTVSSTGGEMSTRALHGGMSNTHRLRNILEDVQHDESDIESDGGGGGGGHEETHETEQQQQQPQVRDESSSTRLNRFTRGGESLHLPLNEIPSNTDSLSSVGGVNGVSGGVGGVLPGSILTPTSSSHRTHKHGSMRRPPGVPSLSFATSGEDQPLSGQIGHSPGMRGYTHTTSHRRTASHTHSASLPSMPQTGVSLAATTVRERDSAGSSANGSTLHTPLTSPSSAQRGMNLSTLGGVGVGGLVGLQLNSRRSTGPLPPKVHGVMNMFGHGSEEVRVPSLPLHAIASPNKVLLTGVLVSPIGAAINQGYTQRNILAYPPTITARHMQHHQQQQAPLTPFTPSKPLKLDGPLPPSHASLLDSAAKSTQHVHRVHDLSTLTPLQVRQLLRDGDGAGGDDDLDSVDDDDDDDFEPDEFQLEQPDFDAAVDEPMQGNDAPMITVTTTTTAPTPTVTVTATSTTPASASAPIALVLPPRIDAKSIPGLDAPTPVQPLTVPLTLPPSSSPLPVHPPPAPSSSVSSDDVVDLHRRPKKSPPATIAAPPAILKAQHGAKSNAPNAGGANHHANNHSGTGTAGGSTTVPIVVTNSTSIRTLNKSSSTLSRQNSLSTASNTSTASSSSSSAPSTMAHTHAHSHAHVKSGTSNSHKKASPAGKHTATPTPTTKSPNKATPTRGHAPPTLQVTPTPTTAAAGVGSSNVHPFGASVSPDSKVQSFASQLITNNNNNNNNNHPTQPTTNDQLISPAPRRLPPQTITSTAGHQTTGEARKLKFNKPIF